MVEQLPITGGPDGAILSLPAIVTDALTPCAAAAAHRIGVLIPPEQLLITYFPHWNQQRCDGVRAAGCEPGRVLVHARPLPVGD